MTIDKVAQDKVAQDDEGLEFKGRLSYGVPYGEQNIGRAADQFYRLYTLKEFDADITPDELTKAVHEILAQNERIVSRCGTLVSFSAIVTTVSVFLANRQDIFVWYWQKPLYYLVLLIWAGFTLRLLWSLKHHLHSPLQKGFKKEDFIFTAKLYLTRMGIYNNALMVAVASTYLCIIIVLLPVLFSIIWPLICDYNLPAPLADLKALFGEACPGAL